MKVVIVGGGCAGMSAAWQLAKQGRYDVHVYEKSLRLGGKGASVRNQDGRILEHGLHVWLGFYENAFRMMRECYAEVEARRWGPDAAQPQERLTHGSLWDAFFPEPSIGVGGVDPEGRWTVWSGFLPPEDGLPGEDLDPKTNPFTLASYVLRSVNLVKALMQSVVAPPGEGIPGEPRPEDRSRVDEMLDLDFSFDPTRSPTVLVERITQLLRTGVLTTAAGLLQAITILERILQQLNYGSQVPDTILQFIEAIAAQTRKQLRDFLTIDPALRWKTEIIDLVMTIIVGLYSDRVPLSQYGLDSINHIDYREWLLGHGATKTSVNSPFVRGIYDLVFAYEEGDRERPQLAAGVAIRGALRMFFTYRGAMFWRMRSGMGDAVFAPLYRVLRLAERKAPEDGGRPAEPDEQRAARKVLPVTFHFGHALSKIEFALDERGRRYVSRLEFATSGAPEKLDAYGGEALDPCGCWSDDSDPRLQDLGERGSVSLDVGDGFDAVVIAMGVDDVVKVCAGPPASPFELQHWQRMREHVKTVATKSAQVWLGRDLEQLGWYRGSGLVTALGGWAREGLSFETWADMTHTLSAEQAWRRRRDPEKDPDDGSRSVAYFCGVVPESRIAEAVKGKGARARLQPGADEDEGARELVQDTVVARDLEELIARQGVGRLWPTAFGGGGKDPPVIARHVQANVRGSDRYTLSLPNTIQHRISPLDASVVNMTIAGDWTASGLDSGCVESAVMSGMLASHAISEEPALDRIIGYHHP